MDHVSEIPKEIITRKHNTLDDIRTVGPNKPLGYLPFSFIEKEGLTVEKIKGELEQKGLGVKTIQDTSNNEDYLYVFDSIALSNLLEQGGAILNSAKWPVDPDEFVMAVATKKVPPLTPLFDLVADAFADYDNPLRIRYHGPPKWYQVLSPKYIEQSITRTGILINSLLGVYKK